MSRSRRITYSSPWTSTSKRSSGLNRTVSPTLTDRTWGPTATATAQVSRRATFAVAGIRIPARERRSPSAWPTWTSTRSASTLMGSLASPPMPVAGASEIVVATVAGYRSPVVRRTRRPWSGGPHRDTGGGQMGLGVGHRELTEVEDRGGQHRVCGAVAGPGHQVVQLPHPTRGHQRHRAAPGDGTGELQVEPVPGPVTIHRRHQQLAGSEGCAPLGPRQGVESGGGAPAVGEDLPFRRRPRRQHPATGVDGDDHALAAELVGQLGDEVRPVDRRRVDAHLVGPGAQEPSGIVDGADTAPDGERDEHLLGRAGHHLDHGAPVVRRGGDVEEHQLVRTLTVVAGGELHRVAGVEQVGEPDALDHPAVVHVEAGDHPNRAHAATPSATVIRPSTSALPVMAPSSRRGRDPGGRCPRAANASMSATDPTPPEAMTGTSVEARTAARPARSGPVRVPSRSIEVTTTAASPAPATSASTSPTVRPDPSSHPRTATSARPSAVRR